MLNKLKDKGKKYDFISFYNRIPDGSWKWKAMDHKGQTSSPEIIPMTVADMDFPTCPKIDQAISNYVESKVLGYSDPTEEYLESVQKYMLKKHNFNIEKDWILTSPGIVAALSTAIRALTEEKDSIMIFTPVYGPFYEVIENQNRTIVKCPLLLKDNRYFIDFDLFEKILSTKSVKLLLLCSPHNPSGRVWSKEELTRINEICLANNTKVVSDEIHNDIIFYPNKHTIFGAVSKESLDNTIICTAASKTFNIAGLQCSNIIIANKETRELFQKCAEASGLKVCNVLGMVATKAAYDQCEDWFEEMKEVIAENQKLAIEFFSAWQDEWEVILPDSGFLLTVNFDKSKRPKKEIMQKLNDSQFYINDGEMFGEESKLSIRVNLGLPTNELKKNLKRLKESFEKNIF